MLEYQHLSTQDKKSMTLPKNGRKLTENEEKSMAASAA